MAKTALFCYGILMKGERYHESHMAQCYTDIHKAKATGRLLYLIEPGCPAMVAGEDVVSGELYEIDDKDLAGFDYLFGYKPGKPSESEFVRRRIEVSSLDNQDVECWCYMLRANVLRERFSDALEIADGYWPVFRKKHEDLEDRKNKEELKKRYPLI